MVAIVFPRNALPKADLFSKNPRRRCLAEQPVSLNTVNEDFFVTAVKKEKPADIRIQLNFFFFFFWGRKSPFGPFHWGRQMRGIRAIVVVVHPERNTQTHRALLIPESINQFFLSKQNLFAENCDFFRTFIF
ncbi:hypothetical protein CEXT_646011 [Caerostris extrusa]|uniref:Uncharacterized protein n=1 Tax=Caerostris extrusa TaxID=172846 RepID=A0AAV4MG09_CAEEX|nr:hypothetical protein CEXT_646011 [Caerostris extrusa]